MARRASQEHNSSNFVGHEPCPKCGSEDNCAVFDDGHKHCFSAGCDYHTASTSGGTTTTHTEPKKEKKFRPLIPLSEITFRDLPKRKLYEGTLKHWKYGLAKYNDKTVQVATFFEDGRPRTQKVRFPDKGFLMLGDTKNVPFYGQHLCEGGGKKLVVTEGELDALTVSQCQDLKWPVVSIPNGADSAKRTFQDQIEFLERFDEVVIMFDMDDPGQKAAEECATILTPGKAKIASLPLKDASDVYVAKGKAPIIDAMWRAKAYFPGGLRRISELIDEALTDTEPGIRYPWAKITEETYGTYDGQIIGIGAGVGCGKTEVFMEICKDRVHLGRKVGCFYLEQDGGETLKRIGGKLINVPLHLPGAEYDKEALRKQLLEFEDSCIIYDNFGHNDWEIVKRKIQWLSQAWGVKDIFLDNLTALISHSEDLNSDLSAIMEEMASLAKREKITIWFVSHLTTPEGKPHEEGGRVYARHFYGSRAISRWAHIMLGLERNTQAEDEETRNITTLRILKHREKGRTVGNTYFLKYNEETNSMTETDPPPKERPGFHGDAEGDAPYGHEDF